jgi:hypothetical protein
MLQSSDKSKIFFPHEQHESACCEGQKRARKSGRPAEVSASNPIFRRVAVLPGQRRLATADTDKTLVRRFLCSKFMSYKFMFFKGFIPAVGHL